MSTVQGPFEDRVAEALNARAALKTVDPATLQRRRAEVEAAVTEDVVSLDVLDDAPLVGIGSMVERRRRQRRSALVVLVAAAAALVLAVVAVGVTRLVTGDAPPASSSPSDVWRDYVGVDHEQTPEDLKGVPVLGSSVDPRSVRLLTRLGQVAYWVGADDGKLCWAVSAPSSTTGGCDLEPSAPQPLEVSDGVSSPELWLVPIGTDTSDLEQRGFVALDPSVWVDADAWGTAGDLLGRLRAAPTKNDAFPAGEDAVGSSWGEDVVTDSQRLLAATERDRYWVGEDDAGRVCLFVLIGVVAAEQVGGSSCQTPVVVAGDGMSVGGSGPAGRVTAWLAPDRLDTSGWPALDRVQLAPNLWVDRATGEVAVLSELRSTAEGPLLVDPRIGQGPGELGTFSVDGPYAVLIRCIGSAPSAVAIDGVVDHSTIACVDGASRAVFAEGNGSPATVTVMAGEDAPWAAAVVECSREADQGQCS